MKIFNTLQELWSYSLFCPICRDITRKISFIPGQEHIWNYNLETLNKTNNIITLEGTFNNQYRTLLKNEGYLFYPQIKIEINTITNSFEFQLEKEDFSKNIIERLDSEDLFFHLESDCKKCYGSWTISLDCKLKFLTKKIEQIGVELEEIWFDKKYIILYNYDANKMSIDKIVNLPNVDGSFYETPDGNPLMIPLMKLDLKNKNKTLNRIKTILTFS